MSIADGLTYGDEETSSVQLGGAADFMASLAKDLGVEPELLGSDETPAPPAVPAVAGETDGDDGDNSGAGDGEEQLSPEQKELKELHALLGRQSAELGELRKAVEAKPDPVEEQQWQAPPPITDDVVEEIEQTIIQGKERGNANAGQDLAVWALTNRPDLYETVLDTWAEQSGADARKAAEFNFRYQGALQQQEAEAQATANREFQEGLAAQMDAEVAILAPEYGLKFEDETTALALAEALTTLPKSVQKLVVSRDPSERQDGYRTVLAIAASKATTTPAPEDPAAVAARAAALEQMKGGAGVGLGTVLPAPPVGAGGGNEPADFAASLRAAILETPSTSVQDGLTYGKS